MIICPTHLELMVSFGIWATGLLIFTLLMKVAIPIESGEFSHVGYVERTSGSKKNIRPGNRALLTGLDAFSKIQFFFFEK